MHNAEVGGVPNSQHVLGTAADITIPEIGFDRARELAESIDFDGTGFYSPLDSCVAWFIHVDTREAVSAVISSGGIKKSPCVFVTWRCLQTDIFSAVSSYDELR